MARRHRAGIRAAWPCGSWVHSPRITVSRTRHRRRRCCRIARRAIRGDRITGRPIYSRRISRPGCVVVRHGPLARHALRPPRILRRSLTRRPSLVTRPALTARPGLAPGVRWSVLRLPRRSGIMRLRRGVRLTAAALPRIAPQRRHAYGCGHGNQSRSPRQSRLVCARIVSSG